MTKTYQIIFGRCACFGDDTYRDSDHECQKTEFQECLQAQMATPPCQPPVRTENLHNQSLDAISGQKIAKQKSARTFSVRAHFESCVSRPSFCLKTNPLTIRRDSKSLVAKLAWLADERTLMKLNLDHQCFLVLMESQFG